MIQEDDRFILNRLAITVGILIGVMVALILLSNMLAWLFIVFLLRIWVFLIYSDTKQAFYWCIPIS